MRIALVSAYDYAYAGGVNTHILQLKDNFTRLGHEVKIIAPSSRPDETVRDHDAIVFGKPVPIRASGSVVRSPISPRLLFSSRIKDVLRQERFDVIHLHEPLMPMLPTSVLHHSSNELLVGTFHAYRSNSWGYTFWKPIILQKWFDKLHGRIAVSEAAREFIGKYFPGEYTIIPNGIDWQHFASDADPFPEYCDGKLNVLFVGRMEKRKGFKYLLGAYELVKREFPNCRLIVVGPPSRASRKYQLLAAKRGLEDIVFIGFASYDDLLRYYRTADVFCSPATGKESFGMVLLEAMAAGKPVVASRIEGYSAVVSHGADGLLVRPQDEKPLADALLQLLLDQSLRDRMGARGRVKAKDFGWDRVSREVLVYYEELLEGRPKRISEEIALAQRHATELGAAPK
jgi:phosphatidylinositol alpha-mannosyltransferase